MSYLIQKFELQTSNDRLQLIAKDDPKFKPFFVDFIAGRQGYRRQFGGDELIVKAVGAHKQKNLSVLDCTAGLGRDAFVLASAGCEVLMLERSVFLFQLLSDGMRRYAESDLPTLNWQLFHQEAIEFLKNSDKRFSVIYLDPMYPERKKSALVKKDLRIIRELVGDDCDSDQLFQLAMKNAKNKVVVKRSKAAEFIAGLKPNYQVVGKAGRFDVYCIQA